MNFVKITLTFIKSIKDKQVGLVCGLLHGGVFGVILPNTDLKSVVCLAESI